jgi:hypothetical protein
MQMRQMAIKILTKARKQNKHRHITREKPSVAEAKMGLCSVSCILEAPVGVQFASKPEMDECQCQCQLPSSRTKGQGGFAFAFAFALALDFSILYFDSRQISHMHMHITITLICDHNHISRDHPRDQAGQ